MPEQQHVDRSRRGGDTARLAHWALRSWLFRAIGLVVLLQCLVLVRYAGPSAKPADAPADEFSAGRAMQVLDRLMGNGMPHPVGSDEHGRMRDRVIAEFAAAGYDAHVQTAFTCNPRGRCADVQNIVARLRGSGKGHAILVVAHYDSVPAAPGAADDAQGVAVVVEVARMLLAEERMRNDVIFLVTDAEELGLLGAYGFAEEHPWRGDVRAVLNLEARGSRGPSLMFQTGPMNRRLIALMSDHVTRPFASSLFSAVYERMPNDTDFSVFNRLNLPGLNFAFGSGWPHYHTPLDDIAHLEPRSVQHHGDNVLSMVRALGDTVPAFLPGEAVFFDVLGYDLISWRRSFTVPVAIIPLALAVATYTVLRGRGELTSPAVASAIVCCVLAVAAAALCGHLAVRLLTGVRVVAAPWTAYPFPAWLVVFSLGLGVPVLLAMLVGRRLGAWSMATGAFLLVAALGVVAALVLPGGSYLFIAPGWVLAAACVVALIMRRSAIGPAVVGVVALGILWLPGAKSVQETLGFAVAPLLSGGYAVVGLLLAPLVVSAEARERRSVTVLAVVALGAGFVAAFLVPHHTARWPVRMNLQFHQEAGANTARWLLESRGVPLPEALRKAVGFTQERVRPFPFSREVDRRHVATAPALAAPGPTLTVEENLHLTGARRLRMRLRSPRGAATVFLFVSPESRVLSCKVSGREMEPLDERVLGWTGGWRPYSYHTLGPAGVEMVLTVESFESIDVILRDDVFGLPPEGDALVAARPDWAGPQAWGDLWTMTRRMQL